MKLEKFDFKTYELGYSYGNSDMLPQFIANSAVYVMYDEHESIGDIARLSEIEEGDLILIKSARHGFKIRAIGRCTDSNLIKHPELGYGKRVKYYWLGDKSITVKDKDTLRRNNAVNREYNPEVTKIALELEKSSTLKEPHEVKGLKELFELFTKCILEGKKTLNECDGKYKSVFLHRGKNVYYVNGDTKAKAMSEFINLYMQHKENAVEESGSYLRLRGKKKANGFYCYKKY